MGRGSSSRSRSRARTERKEDSSRPDECAQKEGRISSSKSRSWTRKKKEEIAKPPHAQHSLVSTFSFPPTSLKTLHTFAMFFVILQLAAYAPTLTPPPPTNTSHSIHTRTQDKATTKHGTARSLSLSLFLSLAWRLHEARPPRHHLREGRHHNSSTRAATPGRRRAEHHLQQQRQQQ